MKVVHICNVAIPPDHPDYGRVPFHPGRWVLNLALAQKRHSNVSPELLMHVPGASQDYHTQIEDIPVHFIKAPDRLRAASLLYFDKRRLARAAQALAPDLLHAHGTEDAYALAAQMTGLPQVITVQGLHFLISRRIRPKLVSRERVMQLLERRCLMRARDAIAKSCYVGEALAARFPHLRLHQIPNTIDPKLLAIRANKQPHVVAFVGSVIPVKGVDLLCDALEITKPQVPDVALWVFGDSEHSSTAYERSVKQRLHAILGDRVVFHGTVPHLDLARKIAQSVALVAPSREEMFGNQVIEALLLGTHAIVTDNTAMAENVRQFGGGTIVPQENAGALASAIVARLQDKGESDSAEVRSRVVKLMGPETVARQHESLYLELVERCRNHRS